MAQKCACVSVPNLLSGEAAAPGQQSVTTTDLHANGSEQNAASEEMRLALHACRKFAWRCQSMTNGVVGYFAAVHPTPVLVTVAIKAACPPGECFLGSSLLDLSSTGHMGSLHIGSYLRNWPKDVELRPELRRQR
eukprot:6490145-Amphidinium_carterae.1